MRSASYEAHHCTQRIVGSYRTTTSSAHLPNVAGLVSPFWLYFQRSSPLPARHLPL